jgi:hypothetical protein
VPDKIIYCFIYLLLILSTKVYSQHDLSVLKKGELYGIANSKGKFLVAPEYKDIQTVDQLLFAVKNTRGYWGFFLGETKISECEFDNFKLTKTDRIIVQKVSRWGVINYKGETVVPFNYQYINYIEGHKFRMGRYNQWKVRTFNNDVLATYEYDSLTYLGDNVYKFCLAGRYGLIDNTGKIITTEFQNMFESTLMGKYPKKEFEKETKITAKGNFKIPEEERFDTVYHFSEGFAKFQSGRKFGFVDSLGNIRLVPQYNDARHFSEGMVAVVLIGKWGFMNKDEKLCVQPYYDEVSDFKNGKAVVRKDNMYNMLNKEGVLLYGDYFDKIIPTYSGKYILIRKKKVGMADKYGHEIISTKYEDVAELGNSYIVAKEHGLWGVLNEKGNIVISFNYSVIQYDPEHNRILTMEPGSEIIIEK